MTQRDNQLADIAAAPIKRGFFLLSELELEQLWEIAKPTRSLDLSRSPLGQKIAKVMRAHAPIAGTDYDKLLTVRLDPGKQIQLHQHKRHAVLYYPETTTVVIEGKAVELNAGDMLYLPPFTPHQVPPVTVERLSVAMLIT